MERFALRLVRLAAFSLTLSASMSAQGQRYVDASGKLRVALARQPFSPNGTSWRSATFADIVEKNERDGYFTVGLLATCPSMPGLVAGLQRSGAPGAKLKVGMLWLDAHPDFNTPETTRSGSLGGMPVALATGRALKVMRLDAKLDPPLADEHVVMAGVRLTDPLEQDLLNADLQALREGSRSH